MPIPSNLIEHVTIQMKGQASAEGSNDKNTLFTFNFRRTAIVNPLSKTNIEAAFQAGNGTNIPAALNNRWTHLLTSVRFPDDALDSNVDFVHSTAGGISGDTMPMHNAAFLLFRTALRGKSYRGGKHFGPLSESDTTGGSGDLLNSGAVGRFQAIGVGLLAGFTDSDGNVWVLEIISTTLSQLTVNPTVVTANDVTQILVNTRVGRMRRREVKSVY